MKKHFFTFFSLAIASVFLFQSPLQADWSSEFNVSNNSNYCTRPGIDIDDYDSTPPTGYGRPHIVWTEGDGAYWRTYLRVRDNVGTWSDIKEVSGDGGRMLSMKSSLPTSPHIWVDVSDDKGNIAFSVRQEPAYVKECSEILFMPDAQVIFPAYGDSEYNQYLHHVSGLTQHAITPFVLYNAYYDDFEIYWSQHDQRVNPDSDHDIFLNYQDSGAWVTIYQVSDVGTSENPVSEMGPYAVIIDDTGTNYDGDIHVLSWDFESGGGSDKIIRSIWDEDQSSWSSNTISNSHDNACLPSAAVNPVSDKTEIYVAYLVYDKGNPSINAYYLLVYDYTSVGGDDDSGPKKIADAPQRPELLIRSRPVVKFIEAGEDDYDAMIAYISSDYDVEFKVYDTSVKKLGDETKIVIDNKIHTWIDLSIDPISGNPQVSYDTGPTLPTVTHTPTETPTGNPTYTNTPSPTSTNSPTISPTASSTPTGTFSTATATLTPTPTNTAQPEDYDIYWKRLEGTRTPTRTPTSTYTLTPGPSPTF